jgi:hypothetical protein
MTATFAPTPTDRPRLFDDRPPRARRPASPDREPTAPAAPDREPTSARDPFAPRDDSALTAGDPRGERPAGAAAPRHGFTLDHLISGVWDDLTAHRTVSCPVCHGQMAPRYGSGALPVGGRCRRCGSSLG